MAAQSLACRPRLRYALVAALLLLGLRVLAGIVYEYRHYFPPNFDEATFHIGCEATFTPSYAAAVTPRTPISQAVRRTAPRPGPAFLSDRASPTQESAARELPESYQPTE
jgi:hypothetical protein